MPEDPPPYHPRPRPTPNPTLVARAAAIALLQQWEESVPIGTLCRITEGPGKGQLCRTTGRAFVHPTGIPHVPIRKQKIPTPLAFLRPIFEVTIERRSP